MRSVGVYCRCALHLSALCAPIRNGTNVFSNVTLIGGRLRDLFSARRQPPSWRPWRIIPVAPIARPPVHQHRDCIHRNRDLRWRNVNCIILLFSRWHRSEVFSLACAMTTHKNREISTKPLASKHTCAWLLVLPSACSADRWSPFWWTFILLPLGVIRNFYVWNSVAVIMKTNQLRSLVKVLFLSPKLLFCCFTLDVCIMGMCTCDKLAGRYCLQNSL